MKVSEITNKELADYLRIEYEDLSVSEIADLDILLGIAKAYIKSYTGLGDILIPIEDVGVGDGQTTEYFLANPYIIDMSQTVYIDNIEQTLAIDYSLDINSGKITFMSPPTLGALITSLYKASSLDAHEDFVIVVYVLVQDMHDNRVMYVDKSNVNKVVETILSMYSINLL